MKLISLNVERSKHVDLVRTFLLAQNADVVCLQEVCERDIPGYLDLFKGGSSVFVPMTRQYAEQEWRVEGEAIFTRIAGAKHYTHYYAGSEGVVPDSRADDPATYSDCNRAVTLMDIPHGGATYRIGVTHFTWSPKGQATDLQRSNAEKMIEILANSGEFVLCGDFNAPRVFEGKPGEIYTMLTAKYRDNIPEEYMTSLDVSIHRAGKDRPDEINNKMVDYIFSTPAYQVSDVRLQFGVSDHAAVIAEVSKLD